MQGRSSACSVSLDNTPSFMDPPFVESMPFSYDIHGDFNAPDGTDRPPVLLNAGDVGPSIPLSIQENFAKPDEWEKMRPIITEFYQEMPLDEVMREMRKRSFYARYDITIICLYFTVTHLVTARRCSRLG